MTHSPLKFTLADVFFRDQAAVGASGDLSIVLNRISLAARIIANDVMKAGLHGQLGYTGDVNVQGEDVRALDLIANDVFIRVFEPVESVCAMASEEMDDVHYFKGCEQGKYVVLHDPLDGSGNVDIDGSMGTIFSVHRRKSTDRPPTVEDMFRLGSEQVAAGYVLYGPATVFVYTVGAAVHGFTLDRSVGAFFLTHPELRIPEGKGSYAVNEANEPKWNEATQELVRRFRAGETECGKRSARYVGALVADFHRTLIQGGIYMYPGTTEKPNGKLRLLYEAAPLAMIAECAGGVASNGRESILSIQPTELHQRTPLFIGARPDVEEAERALRG
ncbi:MAG: class 1 fructose-bisphosphatase [Planctomycetes bacterium]|nr:class 1 fructose-bisphosphatase [Planctomycetota bacterium]